MKKLFTFLFALICLQTMSAQVTIWGGLNDPNSTFANGLGDWIAVGITSADPSRIDSALWYWDAQGDAKRGAYYGTRTTINSTSKGGAVVFDSDWLDNGGVVGAFGAGSAPGPQEGALESPVIDCSSFTEVAVRFTQYFRNHESECFIDVTTDGGATWVPFQFNQEILRGAETPRNSVKLIDISSVAGGQKAVQFRFRFSGYYYFWIVDDVTLTSLPDNNLSLKEPFYTPYAYAQPKSVICEDTMIFSAVLSNSGHLPQDNVVFKGEILGSNRRTVLFADSLVINRLETHEDDTTFRTPNYFVPNNLAVGKYYIRWSTYTTGVTDFETSDNSKIDSFVVTDLLSGRAPRAVSGVRAGNGGAYKFGIGFKTANCWKPTEKFFASTVTTAFVANDGRTLQDYSVSLFILRVKPEVLADWSDFDLTLGIASTSVDLLGADSYTCTTEANYAPLVIDITDFNNNGAPNIPLDPGTRYFALIEHPATDGIPVFQVISNEKDYAFPFANVVINDNDQWFNGGFGDGNTPILDIGLTTVIGTDDKPLADNVMSIYPNPVISDDLMVSIHFEKATSANITVADLSGKVMSFTSHDALTQEKIKIDTHEFKAGEYFIRVATDEGTSTKKFVVVK